MSRENHTRKPVMHNTYRAYGLLPRASLTVGEVFQLRYCHNFDQAASWSTVCGPSYEWFFRLASAQ